MYGHALANLLFGLFNLRQTVDFAKENEIDIVYSVSVAKKLYGCTLQRNMNKQKLYRNMLLYFLIMLCGDVESCPGPGLNDVCNIKGLKLCHFIFVTIFKDFQHPMKVYVKFLRVILNFVRNPLINKFNWDHYFMISLDLHLFFETEKMGKEAV